jgi:hypothetical protein
MCSLHRCGWAAVTLLVTSVFYCQIALPQSFKYAGNLRDPILTTSSAIPAKPCVKDARAGPEAASSCDEPTAVIPNVKPCQLAGLPGAGCDGVNDPVQARLIALGKAGQKISRAREKVLEILETENVCRAWFQERDSNPAATFRTLNFVLDPHGEEYVLESRDLGSMNIFRDPYVAKVIQGDGPYAAVTLNTKGAFFSTMARVVEVHKNGGPVSFRGTRLLRVGPYGGDTLPARVITLLHEFGHVLDLLPTDLDDLDGKSSRNTNEVLRSCSAEVESPAHRSLAGPGAAPLTPGISGLESFSIHRDSLADGRVNPNGIKIAP